VLGSVGRMDALENIWVKPPMPGAEEGAGLKSATGWANGSAGFAPGVSSVVKSWVNEPAAGPAGGAGGGSGDRGAGGGMLAATGAAPETAGRAWSNARSNWVRPPEDGSLMGGAAAGIAAGAACAAGAEKIGAASLGCSGALSRLRKSCVNPPP
jgi:hypothetical protein